VSVSAIVKAKRAQRDRARDAGLCIVCCINKARKGKATCGECSAAAYERVKARRATAATA
jgi:hypothetical protein